jgi:hypothetical protein
MFASPDEGVDNKGKGLTDLKHAEEAQVLDIPLFSFQLFI